MSEHPRCVRKGAEREDVVVNIAEKMVGGGEGDARCNGKSEICGNTRTR